jgi:cytochrome c peroxidase
MPIRALSFSLLFALISFVAQAQNEPRVTIVAEGLYYPAGLALLPDGSVLIAEAGGHGERSAGISLLDNDGRLGRLISGIPNTFSKDNLLSAPAVAVSPDGNAIIVALSGSQFYDAPSTIARDLPTSAFGPADLTRRQADRGGVFLLHPFDIAFDESGAPMVTDAAGNGLVIENADGSIRYSYRFAALENPYHAGGRLEALPTGLARNGASFYVTLFGGCPHLPNSGELVEITSDGRQKTYVDGLNMPIDVAVDAAGDLWILEFATMTPRSDCFNDLHKQGASGRLSRINAQGMLETVLDALHFPVSVLPHPDGGLYISETYAGRILRLTYDTQPNAPQRFPPREKPKAAYIEIRDLDQALRSMIDAHGLTPYPGRELIKSESELTRLGRDLFFDPILSGDQNIACATCHHPEFAMADGRVLPIGAGGHGLGESRAFRKLVHTNPSGAPTNGDVIVNPFIEVFIPRNSPTIINSALLTSQFWDGRVERRLAGGSVRTLEDAINDLDLKDPLLAQALFPITSQHEMAGVAFGDYPTMVIRLLLLERLRNNDNYAKRFASVFGTPHITIRQLGEAIAAFEHQLIFTVSPWDDYVAGDTQALTDPQKRGALLFFGALNREVNCAACHSGDLFTDMGFHNLLVPQLGPGKDNGLDGIDDFGRANVSYDYRDQYRFRTPSLRNVELTAPYFHSGAYESLADVIWHHADPWRANIVYDPARQLPPAFQDQVLPYDFERQAHSVARPMQAGLPMSDGDVADLVDFLLSLTDPEARDLSHITPSEVPSGLPLDPLPR